MQIRHLVIGGARLNLNEEKIVIRPKMQTPKRETREAKDWILLYETEIKRRKRIEISDVISIAFVVLGSMIRIEGALIAIVLSVVLFLGQMKCRGKIGKSVLVVAVIFMVGVTTGISRLCYSAEPWSSQMERLDYRTVDWNKLAYSEYKQEYDDNYDLHYVGAKCKGYEK